MKLKQNLLPILLIALTSTLLISTACEEEGPTNSAPTCTITSPDDGATFTQGGTITITAEVEDEDHNLEEVRFYVNGIAIGSVNGFPYNFDWDTSEEETGSFNIKVEAIDAEQEKTSNEINITLAGIVSEVTLVDTLLYADYYDDVSYNLDINNDQQPDLSFHLKNIGGSSGTSIFSKVEGVNGATVQYVSKEDTTWLYPPGNSEDTLWSYHFYEQINYLILGDIINTNTNFTNQRLIIAEVSIDGSYYAGIEQSYIDRNELMGLGYIYMIIKIEEQIAWLKIKVLDHSKILIHSYRLLDEDDLLEIREY